MGDDVMMGDEDKRPRISEIGDCCIGTVTPPGRLDDPGNRRPRGGCLAPRVSCQPGRVAGGGLRESIPGLVGGGDGISPAEQTGEDRPVERICDRAGRDSKGSNAGRVATVYSADAEPLAGDEWPGVRICDRTGQDSKVMRSGSGRLPRILVEPMPDERCPSRYLLEVRETQNSTSTTR